MTKFIISLLFIFTSFMSMAQNDSTETKNPLEFILLNEPLELAEETPPYYELDESDTSIEDKSKSTSKFIFDFIEQNLIYPKQELKGKVEGKVYAIFIIEKDGSVRSVEIIKGVSEALDTEVIRLLKSLPKFVPGTENGKNIRFKYSVPVEFNIKNYKEIKKLKKKSK